MIRIIFICLLATLSFSDAFSQAEIKGTLVDSVHNNTLPYSTISVFRKGVKTVEKVSLADRFGRFIIKDVPENGQLLVEFTHQGFEKVIKEFQLTKGEKKDLGRINMHMHLHDIETVDILPPVRMNGDTIEFNATAFELDSNAVVEDLLHKLPGVMVWGDGKITYNGQEIPTVLVNGKQFFGGDKSISLQNIPKNVLKKIQLYDKRAQENQYNTPNGANYEMNLVLEEGKERMYFGNVTGGLGTDKRYENHLNFNYGNKRTQATTAYSTNNTNKNLQSIDQLLRNTTFKSVGVRNDFNSDFMRSGVNRQHVFGGRYQYDFLATNEVNEKNIIVGDVLVNMNNILLQDTSITHLISNDENVMNSRTNNLKSDVQQQIYNGNVQYTYKDKIRKRSFTMNNNLSLNNIASQNQNTTVSKFDYINNQSLNTITGQTNNDRRSVELKTIVSLGTKSDPKIRYIGGNPNTLLDRLAYDIRLNIRVAEDNSQSENQSIFQDFVDSRQNRTTVRTYNHNLYDNSNDFGLTIRLDNFTLDHDMKIYKNNNKDKVTDLLNIIMMENTNLSHSSSFQKWVYVPKLSYQKNLFQYRLTGRVEKNIFANMQLGMRLHQETNASTLVFRNLKQRFTTFLPETRINQYYSKPNLFTQTSSIGYNYDEEYPTLEQLRPLYDDINPAYRYFGAEYLSKAKHHQILGSFSYNQQKEHGFKFSTDIRHSIYIDGFSDSISIENNQQKNYTIQLDKPMYIIFSNTNINKAFLINSKQTLSLKLSNQMQWQNRTQYLNNNREEVLNTSHNITLETYYTFSDRMMIGWLNNWNRYKRRDKILNKETYRSTLLTSGLSLSYSITKKWAINSNASGTFNTSTYSNNQMIIWNANTIYRLTKSNNLEIKIAVNDLLRQNKGIYFNNGLTEFRTGHRNNLTQYFMLSVSYFPRKFGF